MFDVLACFLFFFFNDTATTEIYTLSLHDALPILVSSNDPVYFDLAAGDDSGCFLGCSRDRKSTRLNSSHGYISYAVFCLKKKKNEKTQCTHLSLQLDFYTTSLHDTPTNYSYLCGR